MSNTSGQIPSESLQLLISEECRNMEMISTAPLEDGMFASLCAGPSVSSSEGLDTQSHRGACVACKRHTAKGSLPGRMGTGTAPSAAT